MPALKQELLLALREGIRVFVRLEAGIGRKVPSFEELLERRSRQVQNLQQRLRVEQSGPRAGEQSGDDSSITGGGLPEPDHSIQRLQVFRSLVASLRPGRMLDLGAGTGIFSIIAAEAGWEVDAVDARNTRIPDPETEENPKRAEVIRSIPWIESDVRHFPISDGGYDLVCIIGLMHHLELEDQLRLLRGSSSSLCSPFASRRGPNTQRELTRGVANANQEPPSRSARNWRRLPGRMISRSCRRKSP